MKNRLLEDIDDSQSGVPARPVRRVQVVGAPIAAAEATGAGPRQRAGVWRKREPVAAPQPRRGEPSQSLHPPRPSPAPEPPRMTPGIAPEIASFSSPQPDWTLPLQQETPPWTERWGRKALGWTVGLAAAVALACTAAWMYRDTQVESTLAVVADHTTPASGIAQVPLPSPAPIAAEAQAPPPLKLLPPEPLAAAPADDSAALPAAGAVAAAAAPLAAAVVGPSAQAGPAPQAIEDRASGAGAERRDGPATKRAPERRLAAAPVKRSQAEPRKPAAKPVRERVLARATAPAVRSAKAVRPAVPETPPAPAASPLEETLRLCRAAGYHATACLKRGCEATRFGLACRG